jgi:hypothetical protein
LRNAPGEARHQGVVFGSMHQCLGGSKRWMRFIVVDHRFAKRMDVYAGIMWLRVQNGRVTAFFSRTDFRKASAKTKFQFMNHMIAIIKLL